MNDDKECLANYKFSPGSKYPIWEKARGHSKSIMVGGGGCPGTSKREVLGADKQAFREFLVSPALVSNLNVHKGVGLSHVKY